MPLQRELPSPRRSSKRTRFATSALGAGALMIGAAMVLEPASAQTGATCEINGVATREAAGQRTTIILAKQLPGGTLARKELARAIIEPNQRQARFVTSVPVPLVQAENVNGRPQLTNVETYNPDLEPAYTRENNIPCGVFFTLPTDRISQLSPAVTAGISTPDARVITATAVPPTPTERVVVATPVPPTATERVVTATPVPATATERVVVATEVPPTPTAKVITRTPTATVHTVLATAEPIPRVPNAAVQNGRDWGDRVASALLWGALGAAVVGGVAGAVVLHSRREHGGGLAGRFGLDDDAIEPREVTLFNKVMEQKVRRPSAFAAWVAADTIAREKIAALPPVIPDLIKEIRAQDLINASNMPLPADVQTLLANIKLHRRRLAAIDPAAAALITAEDVSEGAITTALTGLPPTAVEKRTVFDTTKAIEPARAALPIGHPLNRFDERLEAAKSVTSRRRRYGVGPVEYY